MYAIKIVSTNLDGLGNTSAFHLAEEVSYSHCRYASTTDFWAQVELHQPSHQLGNSPEIDGKGEGWYVDLRLYKDGDIIKEFFVMPVAWVYIMQDGKTIEVVNVK